MRTILAIVVASLLTGCNPRVVKEYVYVPVEVKVPVPVKCKVTWPEPPLNIGRVPIPPTMDEQGILLMQENEGNRKYANELRITLKQCSE